MYLKFYMYVSVLGDVYCLYIKGNGDLNLIRPEGSIYIYEQKSY